MVKTIPPSAVHYVVSIAHSLNARPKPLTKCTYKAINKKCTFKENETKCTSSIVKIQKCTRVGRQRPKPLTIAVFLCVCCCRPIFLGSSIFFSSRSDSSLLLPLALVPLVMDDGEATTKTEFITVNGKTELTMVYTNEESIVEKTLAMYETWLAGEEHKFMGLDLEYTPKRAWRSPPQEIAVVQLSMGDHITIAGMQIAMLFILRSPITCLLN